MVRKLYVLKCLFIKIKIKEKEGKNISKCLKEKYKNVQSAFELDLTNVFDKFTSNLPEKHNNQKNELSLVNEIRLRMTTLYYYAQLNNYLVLGTWEQSRRFWSRVFYKIW